MGESSRATLPNTLTVIDSYVMKLPHAEDSFRAFTVSIGNNVGQGWPSHKAPCAT